MASYTVAVLCPYCQSDAVVKHGQRSGKHRRRIVRPRVRRVVNALKRLVKRTIHE